MHANGSAPHILSLMDGEPGEKESFIDVGGNHIGQRQQAFPQNLNAFLNQQTGARGGFQDRI